MNNNVLVVIGAFALLFGLSCVLILIGAVWVGKVEDHHDEEEYRQLLFHERAVQASLRRLTGDVQPSTQAAPYDREKVLEGPTRAELDFVYGLHLIDAAFDPGDKVREGRWDQALGEGRN